MDGGSTSTFTSLEPHSAPNPQKVGALLSGSIGD